MERRNRNTWIIVAIIAVVLLLCCLALGGAAVLAALRYSVPVFQQGTASQVVEETEQVYEVDAEALLEIDSFAGNITVRSGPAGEMRLVARKRASSTSELERIEVGVTEQAGGLRIRATHPGGVMGNRSVEFDLTVPPDTTLNLVTGAGNVTVDGIEGEIAVRTGAGNVNVRDAAAPVDLDTGAGNIDYAGEPVGTCTFNSGAGNITLRLPADAGVEVALNTGVGNIELGGFDVEGDIRRTEVTGVIGTGEQATLDADAGVGNITLVRR